MSLSAQQRNQTSLQLANFVDWNHISDLKKMRRKIHKMLKKSLQTKIIQNNKINSFEVISANLSSVPTMEQRKETENKIIEIFKQYSDRVNRSYKQNVQYNGDSNYYKPVIQNINDPNLWRKMKEIQHQKIDIVLDKISDIITNSFVTTWSLASPEPDKVVIGDFSASVLTNVDQNLEFMVDELLIYNLGQNFIPFTNSLFSELHPNLSKLSEILKKSDFSPEMVVLLPHFVGNLSGLQESLKLSKRQIHHISALMDESIIELEELDSEELNRWLRIINKSESTYAMSKIEVILDEITNIKNVIREKNGMTDKENKELALLLIEIRSQISAIRLWIHRFEDIPSFTTLENGIAFEEVENEIYYPKDEEALIEAITIFKNYQRGNSSIYALRGIDLTIREGEFLIIKGPSGAGKTTLLSILAGLEEVNRGAVFFKQQNLTELSDKAKSKIRSTNFAFIFQDYALIPHLTAYENTKLPAELSGLSKPLREDILKLLDDVGIGEYSDHKPAYLSGGQMQRLGIARALASTPKIIFADEATGDLDRKTSRVIMDLLKRYNEETGVTIVFVTHDDEIATYGNRQINLKDGQIA